MIHHWEAFRFLVAWTAYKILTDLMGYFLFKGYIGNVAFILKELIHYSVLVIFVYIIEKENLVSFFKREKRVDTRVPSNKKTIISDLVNKAKIIGQVINISSKGMLIVIDTRMKNHFKKGVFVCIEKDIYKIVHGQSKAFQYHIGLVKI